MDVSKIQRELEGMSPQQRCRFAWSCAVRALPFLAGDGHLEYWKSHDRRRILYDVFYAIDAARIAGNDNEYNNAATDAYAAAAAYAADSAADAHADADANAADYDDDVHAAAYADAAAAHAYDVANAAANAANAASAASAAAYVANANAAAANAAYAAAAAAQKYNLDFTFIILEDLQTIKAGEEQKASVEIYGELWHRFKKALANEGCSYWGDLYEEIFNNNFVLDEEALQRRLNVPREIRNQGAAKVAAFLIENEKGAQRLNEARVIVLGDKGAGKTCIARRLVNPAAPMTEESESTAGVDTSFWNLEKENVNVRIWDFAGHVITHSVHQFFLSERSLYLIVYDGRTDNKDRLEYWLNHMKNYGGSSKAIILINQRDPHPVTIPINTLRERYAIRGVYTFSIRDDHKSLAAFRQEVAEYITGNPSWNLQVIPTSYYRVKEALEARFLKAGETKGDEYITRQEFDEIASKYLANDAQELLQDLHYLGVSLWYAKMEKYNTLILNPEWIAHGVYRIINWLRGEGRHNLKLADLSAVFATVESRFPSSKFEFLFSLIKYYELAYETDDCGCLIFPCLLEEDRPEQLPDFPVGKSLALRYEADQPLLPNTISRFIVRHNQEIKTFQKRDIVWKCGVVLEDGKGSLAMVREDMVSNSITVSVKGTDKSDYLSALRATLNDIFEEYKNVKPSLKYRISEYGELKGLTGLTQEKSLWLTEQQIINHYVRNRKYFDDNTGMEIPMDGAINIYKIDAETVVLGGQGHQIVKNTFNFNDCNINLQGNLHELARLLTERGDTTQADELKNIAEMLESVEDCTESKEVKKKGIMGRLQGMVEELADENSSLHNTVKKVKHGVKIAQGIAKRYNDIAQWAGLPQVPSPLL